MKPIIFLAFANDQEGGTYLRKLPEELRQIRTALQAAADDGFCEIIERANVTVDEIMDVFQKEKNRGRIALFHYGGHADGYQLLLESKSGNQAAHGAGLVAFFARQEGLKMIFFNGCTTKQQTKELSEKGISVVIGTNNRIKDDIATNLAARFYHGLGQKMTIGKAWEDAIAEIDMTTEGGKDRGMVWMGMLDEQTESNPWEMLAPDAAAKDWKLKPITPPEPKLTDMDQFKKELNDLVDNQSYADVFSKIENSDLDYDKFLFNNLRGDFQFQITRQGVGRLKILISSLKKKEQKVAPDSPPPPPPVPEDPKARILHFMGQGDLARTIEAFSAYAKTEDDSELEMDLILQSGRYNGAKNRYNTGATSEDDMRRLEAQIMNALKSMYQDLE